MSQFTDFLRGVGYFGLGAAAVIVEAGGKVVNALVSKGEKTIQDNQETVDEIKRKTHDLGQKMKSTIEKMAKQPAAPVDAAQMTPEERAELRRQLDEADRAEAQPVAPDAYYHTDEPVPEEAPAEEAAVEEEAVEEEAPAEEAPVEEAPAEGAEPNAEAAEAVSDQHAPVEYTAAPPAEEAPASAEIPVLEIPEEDPPKDPFYRY